VQHDCFLLHGQNGPGSKHNRYISKSQESSRVYYWHKQYRRVFSVAAPEDNYGQEQWGSIIRSRDDVDPVGHSNIFAYSGFSRWFENLLTS
jgi:hypothetical protein